ncbi:MAG: aminotransferase class V-fold PLP-dependent enzyme [Gemmatimonadota bacterium]
MKEVRRLFPGVEDQVYLDVSLRSLIPVPVAEAVERHLRERLSGTGDKSELQAAVERSRDLMAELLGCTSDEIAITKNVSEGLNLFAASLPWTAGDNVVICPELEHPNNVFLWYNLRKLKGIDVRALEPDEGRIPVEAMAAAVDERTRLVTVPHVSFSPGFVTDVRTMADAAHAQGALLLVDGAQSVGAIRTRVDELGFDALAVATQKSLLSLYGFGFLYVRRPLADTLVPGHVARYGMDLGADAGETARSGGDLPYAAGARRFDLGNFNYLGARAAEAALSLIRRWGVGRIETHVRALSARLAAGMLELGLPVAGGSPGPHLGHIVAVGHSGGGHHDTADDPAMNDLHRYLADHGVRLSIRRGVLRMSVGVYNDVSDVDRVLELARRWMESRSNSRYRGP